MLNYSSLVTMLDKGLCCSQMIIQQGLEDTGQEDNPGLITAVSGLCKGMHSRQICGAISGSVCLLSLCAPDNISDLAKQVVEWFVSEYEGKYESINCGDILGDDVFGK